MGTEYQPRFPKAKLREIVIKYQAAMRLLGHEPNCSVGFDCRGRLTCPPRARGWLLKDTRPGSTRHRYVLLEDGDVWREVESMPPLLPFIESADSHRLWLNGPDDELITLMARSQANARVGLDAYFEREENVQLKEHVVTDRRSDVGVYHGPDRRLAAVS